MITVKSDKSVKFLGSDQPLHGVYSRFITFNSIRTLAKVNSVQQVNTVQKVNTVHHYA